MNTVDIFERLKSCIDSEVNGWARCDLMTEIEKREKAQNMIYGIVKAGLYLLPGDYYSKLVKYVHENGFNH